MTNLSELYSATRRMEELLADIACRVPEVAFAAGLVQSSDAPVRDNAAGDLTMMCESLLERSQDLFQLSCHIEDNCV